MQGQGKETSLTRAFSRHLIRIQNAASPKRQLKLTNVIPPCTGIDAHTKCAASNRLDPFAFLLAKAMLHAPLLSHFSQTSIQQRTDYCSLFFNPGQLASWLVHGRLRTSWLIRESRCRSRQRSGLARERDLSWHKSTSATPSGAHISLSSEAHSMSTVIARARLDVRFD